MAGNLMLAPMLFVAARATGAQRWTAPLRQAWRRVNRAAERVSSSRALLEMDDRMLQDLGISRAQAEFEAHRTRWHVLGDRHAS